jgi:hypothetical protein
MILDESHMAVFGLEVSDFIAISALGVAVSSVLFTYSRNRKSEQIKIAREIRDKINIGHIARHEFLLKKKFPDEGSVQDKRKWITDLLYILSGLAGDLGYFTFLVKHKEIDNTNVLNYYKVGILKNLREVDLSYASIEEKMNSDTILMDAVTTSLGDRASPEIAEVRSKLSEQIKLWEHK